MKPSVLLIFLLLCFVPLGAQEPEALPGAESISSYLPLLKGKRIALFTNHTGRVGGRHLADFLHGEGIRIEMIFAPEHGFRGESDAGEKVDDSRDPATGIPIVSLYRSRTGKPRPEQMAKIDLLLFDIQDVGLRFYTYYISMYKLMDACAQAGKPMIVLDRPNPNGFYIDGPILDMKYKSGVGYLPIPVVHGMTLGELARMINGEGWLPKGRVCDLKVICCTNYTHRTYYRLPVPPSPNLPTMKAVYLYPSLCLFEGTSVSLGRGTDFPFQVYGSPDMTGYSFSFTPRAIPGAKNPPHLNRECFGVDLREVPDEEIWEAGINLKYLLDAYRNLNRGKDFFIPFFRNLIGTDRVEEMILQGMDNEEIKATWQEDIRRFREQRRPYLLYEE